MPYEEWMDDAKCADMTVNPDIYFSTDPDDIRRAKQICGRCPVQQQCGEYAIRNREREGLWAGMETVELRQAARRVGVPVPRPRRIA